ncbi:hypothetical protein LEP1GSC170_1214 [Leptospira interrogans serovar Bataviae str. HAI135]|nr:hypothetical protein LEP1GSC170_1214 [Leptospira interrogans serovar Bataviae str. HAI135]
MPDGGVIDLEDDLQDKNYEKLNPILRKTGWRYAHEEKCEICGLYPLGMEKYLLNDEGICRECENSR